jgi:hypothetical protein
MAHSSGWAGSGERDFAGHGTVRASPGSSRRPRRRLSTWPAAGGLVACGQGHAEHIVDVPLEAGEGDHDAGRRGEHEQLDPVTVDQGLAEVDAELKVVVERPQPARGSQEAVAGAEDRPAVLAVGPQY